MNVSISDIEDKVVKVIMNSNKNPTVVLLDTKTYEQLQSHFRPIVKDEIEEVSTELPKAIILHTTFEFPLDILEVKVDRDFFEVI